MNSHITTHACTWGKDAHKDPLPPHSKPTRTSFRKEKNGIGSSYLVKFIFPATSTPTAASSHLASHKGATADHLRSQTFTAIRKKKKKKQQSQNNPNPTI